MDFILNISTRSFTASFCDVGRYSLTCEAFSDGSIIVMGGYSSAYINEVWKSTDGGVGWVLLTSNAWASGQFYFISVVYILVKRFSEFSDVSPPLLLQKLNLYFFRSLSVSRYHSLIKKDVTT